MHLLGEEGEDLEKQVIVWQKPPSYTKGEPMQIFTTTKKHEDEATKTLMEQEPERPTRAVPISNVRPFTRPNPKVKLIESSSRPPLTDLILEIYVPQKTALVIDITPPEPQVTQREGMGIATEEQIKPSLKKLVPALREVHHGKIYQLTGVEIQAQLDKEEEIKKKAEEARLLAMTKSELSKVVHEEAKKAKTDPKIIFSAKGGEQFKKIQNVKHQVLKREHS
nr:hypothetical protein [Tanacetum cinerariifolium]